MNLFDNTDKMTYMKEQIFRFVSDSGYRVLNRENSCVVFDKDEQVASIAFCNKEANANIELSTTLFDDLGLALGIMMRSIAAENFIRDLLKSDLLRKVGCKLELVRIIKMNNTSLDKHFISSKIRSLNKKAKKLQKELEMQLDYLMLIKLN